MAKCSKAKALKIHTTRRVHQRYGLNVNVHDLARLIQERRGTFVKRRSHRVTIWDVEYKGEILRVVYDKKRGLPITALPKN